MKFKVGDKVRWIDYVDELCDNKTIYEVLDIGELGDDKYYLEFIDNSGLKNRGISDCFELADKSSNKALRYNTNKVEFNDIPVLGLIEVAKAGKFGQSKYSRNNWRKEAPTTQYLDAAMRHILKYLYVEDIASDSKVNHVAHAAWNLLTLLEKIAVGQDQDDRFKYPNEVNFDELFELNQEQIEAIEKVKREKNNEN